jgi:hypothetical protein
MSSNQLDPRTMAEAQSVSNFVPGSRPADLVHESAWVVWVQFAAVMMMLLGTFHVIEGLVALVRDEVLETDRSGLAVDVSYTAWGWGHIIWGLVAVVTGISLLAGRTWARVVAVAVAFVSAVGNVAFMSAQPFWSTLMIALDIIVIWAVMVHGGELRKVPEPT